MRVAARFRCLQRRLVQDGADIFTPMALQPCEIRCDTGFAQCCVDRVAGKHFAGVRPQQIERLLHPAMALVGSVTEPHHDVGRAIEMVADFLQRLCRDFRDARALRVFSKPAEQTGDDKRRTGTRA